MTAKSRRTRRPDILPWRPPGAVLRKASPVVLDYLCMFTRVINRLRPLLVLGLLSTLAACVSWQPGIGRPVSWSSLDGWQNDSLAEAWPAFQKSCERLAGRNEQWANICTEVDLLENADDATRRAFIQSRFQPHRVYGRDGDRDGLVTGYYEPLLHGSRTRSKRFRYAIYGRPDDLLVVDLSSLYPELEGKRVRGRLDGKRVVPYFSREQILNGQHPLKGKELLWVDDAVALFFLHIQGSGIVRLEDGTLLGVSYSDQNGHPYRAIGAALVAGGEIAAEDLSLQTIRDWLHDHPDEAEDLMNSNPSYVFFDIRDNVDEGPKGSLGVPLTAARSIAVDPRFIELGLPVWLETTVPELNPELSKQGNVEPAPLSRLVFAQDTGGAINGAVRADLFWGRGQLAEEYAGRMKQPGRLYVLLPKPEKDGRPQVARAEQP